MRGYLILLLLWALTAAPVTGQTNFRERIAHTATEKGKSDTERLHALFALHTEILEETSPENNTWLGKPKHQDKWTDMSLPAIERRNDTQRQLLEATKHINRSQLSKSDQLNYDLFTNTLTRTVNGLQFPAHLMPISRRSGPQLMVPQLFPVMRLQQASDYDNYLLRLERLPTLLDQYIALLKEGSKQGIMPSRVSMAGVPEQVQALLNTDSGKNLLLEPLQKFPVTIPAEKQQQIKSAAEKTAREKINPAVTRLHTYLVTTYLPKTRETISFTALPNGEAWYNYAIRNHTTTDLTYRQIHEIGNAEVTRIRAEMDKLIAASGYKGSFTGFLEFLRTDPQFYYTSEAELVTGYMVLCKKLDAELPRFFGTLPRMPYGVKEIPANQAPASTAANYKQGSKEAGRPGYFNVNTYDLKSRPKWGMECLALHEAVPGHHLQLALAQELENVPEFRQQAFFTAFAEGWALYAESLGEEMGFYQDPYSKFGQLISEMWRALRLVTDTGLHGMGMSRQEAIDLFKANTPLSEHEITQEVDRYITWPGQALSYKIGELKIKELRTNATIELGDQFNLREFHDVVLGNGSLPLDILEQQVNEWIKEKKRK